MHTKNTDLSRLRQLCALGLQSQVLAPLLCEELRQLVAADRVHLAWSDRLGNVVEGFFEKPDAAALDYFQRHSDQFQEDAGLSYRHALLFGKPTGNFRWPFKAGFEDTDSHRALFGNLGLQHCIDGIVRDRDGPLGQIFLLRKSGDPDFTEFEEAQLARALPHVAHAMSHHLQVSESFVSSGDSGLVVFSASGELTHQSDKARALCFYALDVDGAADWSNKYASSAVGHALERLFQQVVEALDAEGSNPSPPEWRVTNSWGEFQLRAYLMHTTHGAQSYGVLVEKLTPWKVEVLQRVKSLPLSNRQMEVCFLLVLGIDSRKIAAMLNMAMSTLKDHSRSIYQKVGAANRKELRLIVLKQP